MKRTTSQGSSGSGSMSPPTGRPDLKKPRLESVNPFQVLSPSTTPPRPERIEKRKQKKHSKNETKHASSPPKFFYSSKEIATRKHAVGIGDLRDLVIHLIGDGAPQPWLKVENPRSIQKVIVLQIPGLTNSLLDLPPVSTDPTLNPNKPISIPTTPSSPLPFISRTFMHALPTCAPGEQSRMHSVLGAFFMGPVTGEEKKRRILARIEDEKMQGILGEGADPARYLLSESEMLENEYPMTSAMLGPGKTLQKGWAEKPPIAKPLRANGVQPVIPIYSMDCEMCVTEDGKELTRVCLIDYHSEKVVLDELVKPVKPIVDYLTRFSGITEAHLESITTTLPAVQAKVLDHLTPETVLLGHSLEQDLRALKIAHPRVIDTALLYHHPRGRPLKPGLAWLTKKWLGREIQNRGDGGHDPEEDARACVDLLKKKLVCGPGFGEFKTDQESILERLQRCVARGTGGVKTGVVDYGNPSSWHGSKATVPIAAKSDDEVLSGLREAAGQCHFVFGRFMELSDALEWSTPRNEAPPPPRDVPTVLQELNKRLEDLHAALPPRTALIIFSGHSDPRPMSKLAQRKAQFENALRAGSERRGDEGWTMADARTLEEATEKAKMGLAFLCLKAER